MLATPLRQPEERSPGGCTRASSPLLPLRGHFLRSLHAASLARLESKISAAVLAPLMKGASEKRALWDQIRSPEDNVRVPDTTLWRAPIPPSNPGLPTALSPISRTASASSGFDANEKHVFFPSRNISRALSAAWLLPFTKIELTFRSRSSGFCFASDDAAPSITSIVLNARTPVLTSHLLPFRASI
jgi:hypothetical protein